MKSLIIFVCSCLLVLFVGSLYYSEVALFSIDVDVLAKNDAYDNVVGGSMAKINYDHQNNLKLTKKLQFHTPDPPMFMNASELIKWNGFPCEVHYVETTDGYILGMQRIPQPSKDRLPVLLMHGLLSSSDCFLTNLVNESLAYILYNEGYDVWLGNVRGNIYSTNHIKLSTCSRKFWKFSFDEIGKYDIPAMVDYVLNQSKHKELFYIGHSQGTTSLFAATLSHGPEFAQKIRKFAALAPAGIVHHMTSVLHYLSYVSNDLAFIFNLFKHGEFLPRQGFINKIANKLCPEEPQICEDVLFLIAGSDLSNMNRSRVPVYTSHNPAGTSVQNMLHWAQMAKHDAMVYYDYGHYIMNWIHYGSIYPPSYDLSKFDIETYAFCGGKDALVVSEDCDHLLTILPNIQKAYFIPSYSHLDFIWAITAKQKVYDDVIKALKV